MKHLVIFLQNIHPRDAGHFKAHPRQSSLLQHRMADMFIECQLARSIVIMAAMQLDSNEPAEVKARAVSAAKSRLSRAIRLVAAKPAPISSSAPPTWAADGVKRSSG